MVSFIDATKNDLQIIKDLAYEIWPIAYGEILSSEQLEYMLDKFYSLQSLEQQLVDRNHKFILVKENGVYLGFASYELHAEACSQTKLHKLYIRNNLQGKGIGKILITEVENRAKQANQKKVFLNVNRYNKAKNFYEKLGYHITETVDLAIGNGYLMEDYIMQKEI